MRRTYGTENLLTAIGQALEYGSVEYAGIVNVLQQLRSDSTPSYNSNWLSEKYPELAAKSCRTEYDLSRYANVHKGGQYVMNTVPQLLDALKMRGALSCYDQLRQSIQDREQLLIRVLETEVQYRRERAMKRRLSQAKFPVDKEWVELDRSLNPSIDFEGIEKLFDGDFVQQRRNVCFIGTQGTGKTHSLISLGRELCRKGHSVRFYTACELVNVLEEAKRDLMLTKVMNALLKPKLLILDELGFVPFSDNGARLLFDVFASRYERGSTAVSTNLSLDKWVEVFGSVELTAALVDRFCHRAEIFAFKGESVRLFQAAASKKSG